MKLKTILILVAILAVAGTIFFIVKLPKSEPPAEDSLTYVWDFAMDNLQHITLTLPREGKSESFVKHEDRQFYFDVANGPQVDPDRWGGGIPLLLSGPGAERPISTNTSDAKLAEYGFVQPNLSAILTLSDGSIYQFEVGDSNPSGEFYYVRLIGNGDVYTVDKSWYEVLARLVREPPYIQATFTTDTPTVSPTEIPAGGTVIISVTVSNNGDLSGSYDVILNINSETQEIKNVTLDPRTSQIVTFNVTENTAGKYVASINTRNVTFVVK